MSLLYVLLFGGVSATALIYAYLSADALFSRQLRDAIAAEVAGLSDRYAEGGEDRLIETIAERSAAPGAALYLLIGADGARLAGNFRSVSPEVMQATGRVQFIYRRPGANGFEERMALVQVKSWPGGQRLIVGRDIEERRTLAEVMRGAFLACFAALTAAGVGVGLFVGRRLLQRIDDLSDESRAILGGDLRGRIPLRGGGDEIDRLTASLNGMFERIERLVASLREVSDNIAHDLRTPLNRLRNRAEAALHGADASQHRDALEAVIEEADDLIRTFDALLSIARLEAGEGGGRFALVNVADIVRNAADFYEPLAEANGLSIVIHAPDRADALGEPQLLAQAIANLIDNALKYGHGVVTLSVNLADGGIEVSVADRGPGVPEHERARAVKRFVRLEASRSKPGSGLGLSLAAAVASLHGGALRLEDNAPGLRAVLAIRAAGVEEAKAECGSSSG
ncbi:MAG: HAMP domain-containing sensor histidine kinase [Hyphomicrobiales bacterium]|nr:HAMP domain-containing sensor histidine kinase [Hyphomicrobiales bacterium]